MQFDPMSTAPRSRQRAARASSRARPSGPVSPKPAVSSTNARVPRSSRCRMAASALSGATPITAISGAGSRSSSSATARTPCTSLSFGCTTWIVPGKRPATRLRSTAPGSEVGRDEAPTTATDFGKNKGRRSRCMPGLYRRRRSASPAKGEFAISETRAAGLPSSASNHGGGHDGSDAHGRGGERGGGGGGSPSPRQARPAPRGRVQGRGGPRHRGRPGIGGLPGAAPRRAPPRSIDPRRGRNRDRARLGSALDRGSARRHHELRSHLSRVLGLDRSRAGRRARARRGARSHARRDLHRGEREAARR